MATVDLRECVEWRRWLWTRPIKWVLGNPARFASRRVLEIGCRYGKMSCYFASLGATVDAVDISERSIKVARQQAESWGLAERINFQRYSGDVLDLPANTYDFVFSKSVLVVMGPIEKSLLGIARSLKSGGEYLAVENAKAGRLVNFVRGNLVHRRWTEYQHIFAGLDEEALVKFPKFFTDVSSRSFWGLVVAIRARQAAHNQSN